MSTLLGLKKELKSKADPKRAKLLQRFFKKTLQKNAKNHASLRNRAIPGEKKTSVFKRQNLNLIFVLGRLIIQTD